MSNVTINDLVNEELGNKASFDNDTLPVIDYGETEQTKPQNELFNKMLTAETGEGSIGDYIEHPLNFNNSKGLAQVIRGITGLAGNLNLAIVDIVFGALRFSKERKGVTSVLSRGSDLSS